MKLTSEVEEYVEAFSLFQSLTEFESHVEVSLLRYRHHDKNPFEKKKMDSYLIDVVSVKSILCRQIQSLRSPFRRGTLL